MLEINKQEANKMPASINSTDTSFFISCFLRGYQVHGLHRKHGAKVHFYKELFTTDYTDKHRFKMEE